MITPGVALTASLLLCSSLVDRVSARRLDETPDPKPVTLTHEDITFAIERYIHGRTGVAFQDDTHAPCEVIYNIAGFFATIVAGSEEYKIMYDDNGDVVDVERRDEGAGARRLKHEDENYTDGVPQEIGVEQRYEAWTCQACKQGWKTVCGVGLVSFCELRKGYGNVFGTLARSAAKTMCGTFSRACGAYSGGNVCVERCDVDSGDADADGSGGGDDDGDIGANEDKDKDRDNDDSSDDDDASGNDKGGDDDASESADGDADEDSDDGGGFVDDGIACPGCGANTTCDGVTCSCLDGHQGDPLVACTDPCSPNPCLHDGRCFFDDGGGHICACGDGFGGMACQTETAGLLGFYIELEFIGDASDWTDERIAIFQRAAIRWEEVVINQRCPVGISYFPGRLLISATLEYIDGPDNTLAEAGPTRSWTACPMSSTAGGMRFDTADIMILEDTGNFDTVVIHEMGHTIGIGTLWGNCSTCYYDLDPDWKCPGAVEAYNDLLGNPGGTAANIIEVSGRTVSVRVRNRGPQVWGLSDVSVTPPQNLSRVVKRIQFSDRGQVPWPFSGTTCGHFSEITFGDELSSGMIKTDIVNVTAPLSKMTAATLDDTGYVVDAAGVDAYTLPSRRGRRTTEADVATKDDGTRYEMRRVAVESTIELIGDDGEVVGEAPGVQIHLYAG